MKSKLSPALKPYAEKLKPYFQKFIWLIMAAVSSQTLYINSARYKFPEKYEGILVSKVLLGRLYFHLKHATKGIDVFSVLFIAVFYFLFSKAPRYKGSKAEKTFAAICSGLIPLVLILCKSYNKIGSWNYVFGSEGAVFLTLIKMVGYGFVIYSLFAVLSNKDLVVTSGATVKAFSFKREMLVYTAVFLVFWSPYMLLLYPGCFTPDAKDEIAQIVGRYVNAWSARAVVLNDDSVLLNTHHPVFYTLVLKAVIKFGELIHSYVIAFELLCLAQAVVLAVSLAFAVAVIKKNNARTSFLGFTVAFFAINPLFPIYSMTIVKDTFFCAMMVFVVVLTYELLFEEITRRRLIGYFCAVFMFIMTRNNGIYIMALVLICVLITQFRDKKRTVKIFTTVVTAMLVFQIGIAGVLYPALHISGGSKREFLPVMFTQTARYVDEYMDEITPEEEKAITTVLNGNLAEIAKSYDPELADSIKSQYCKYTTNDELKEYFKVWLAGLKNHPATYIQAYFNLHYGWFSFEGNNQIAYSKITDKHMDTLIPGFDKYMGSEIMRDFLNYILDILIENPLTAAFLEMATYTWIYLALLVFAIKKKRGKELIVSSIAYFNYLICFAGPVAYMRYTIPMVCTLPFITFIILKDNTLKENNDG